MNELEAYIAETSTWLNNRRLDKGMNIEEFAKLIGYSSSTVNPWLHGKRPIGPLPWKYICQALGLEPSEEVLAFAKANLGNRGKRPKTVIVAEREAKGEVHKIKPPTKDEALSEILRHLEILAFDPKPSYEDIVAYVNDQKDEWTEAQRMALVRTIL